LPEWIRPQLTQLVQEAPEGPEWLHGNAAGLLYFIFDLLHLDGEDLSQLPLIERKARLAALLSNVPPPLHYSDYHRGRGGLFITKPANCRSKASSRNAPMRPMRPAIAVSGSRSNA
jgi:hypothetical protein